MTEDVYTWEKKDEYFCLMKNGILEEPKVFTIGTLEKPVSLYRHRLKINSGEIFNDIIHKKVLPGDF